MQDIHFSQAKGFYLAESPVEWVSSCADDLAHAGFEPYESLCENENNGFPTLIVSHNPKTGIFNVILDGVVSGNDIFVENEAELMALRVALAPLRLAHMPHTLDTIAQLLERLFQVYHGHPAEITCSACE